MTPPAKPRTPSLVRGFSPRRAAHSTRTYTDAELLASLAACARSLGMSPTIDQYNAARGGGPHAHTLIDRFGTWNAALRRASLAVHRRATDEELLATLRDLARDLGRVPAPVDIEAARPSTFSRSTYVAHFGSLSRALRAAGLPVATNVDEQLELAIEAGRRLALVHGSVPTMRAWRSARELDGQLPSEWQIYRLCQGADAPPWSVFSQLVEDVLGAGA